MTRIDLENAAATPPATPPITNAVDAEVDMEILKVVPKQFCIEDEKSANWLIRKVISAREYGDHVKRWAERERRRAEREEAQGYVEDLAVHTATGSMRKINEGVLPTCSSYAYGVDRQYLDAKGTPQFILRWISPHRSERRNPTTGAIEGVIEWDGESKRPSMVVPGGKVKLVPGDRHMGGEYILTGILRSKQGNHRMVGSSSSRMHLEKQIKHRFYRTLKAAHSLRDGSVSRRCINAKPLETEVLRVMQELIGNSDEILSAIRLRMTELLEQATSASSRLEELKTQKAKTEDQYLALTEDVGPLGRELFRSRTAQLEHQLRDLNRRISTICKTQFVTEDQVEVAAKLVTRKLGDLSQLLKSGEIKPIKLRRLLRLLVQKMEVDLATKEVQMEIGLPSDVLHSPKIIDAAVCLESASSTPSALHTNDDDRLILASYTCHFKASWR